MTAEGFRDLIGRLGLSQVASAALLGVDARTARRYASGETVIPPVVARFLRLTEAIGGEGEARRLLSDPAASK